VTSADDLADSARSAVAPRIAAGVADDARPLDERALTIREARLARPPGHGRCEAASGGGGAGESPVAV